MGFEWTFHKYLSSLSSSEWSVCWTTSQHSKTNIYSLLLNCCFQKNWYVFVFWGDERETDLCCGESFYLSTWNMAFKNRWHVLHITHSCKSCSCFSRLSLPVHLYNRNPLSTIVVFVRILPIFINIHFWFCWLCWISYEITSKTALQVNNFLKKMKIPFYVATGAVFAFEIVMSALRGNGYAVDVVIYLNSTMWKYKIRTFRLIHTHTHTHTHNHTHTHTITLRHNHTIVLESTSTYFYSFVFSWCLLSH
jgi:hypothetical protein